MNDILGVAVIGAGMAGRSHAHAYRSATTVFSSTLPEVRLVAIADVNEDLGHETARRYGFERAVASWEDIVSAPDIDAVSVVVANALHRPVVEALLAAGKHVLCEKPLAPNLEDARAMADAAGASDSLARLGFTFRRTPAINAIKNLVEGGDLGRIINFQGRYWSDYSLDPQVPMSWRYNGALGTGALADIGSHIVDLGEFICGPTRAVSGATMHTVITDRPIPLGATVGHARTEVSAQSAPVTNEDVASFSVEFDGAIGSLSVSRVAHGHPNSPGFEVFGTLGAARFDQRHNTVFWVSDDSPRPGSNGYREVLVGPEHPYISQGLAMDTSSVGFGVNDSFTFQAKAFLDEICGIKELPPCATFDEGVHNMGVLDAVVRSAASQGARTTI